MHELDIIIESTSTLLKKHFKTVDSIGRETLANDADKYISLNDTKGEYAYIRYAGSQDIELGSGKPIGGKFQRFSANTRLRLVCVSSCKNIEALKEWVLKAVLLQIPYDITLHSASSDKQAIYKDETGKEALKNNAAKLLSFEFTASYQVQGDCGLTFVCDKC